MEARFYSVVLGLTLLAGCTEVEDDDLDLFDGEGVALPDAEAPHDQAADELLGNAPAAQLAIGYPYPDTSCSSGNVIGVLTSVVGRGSTACSLPGTGLPASWQGHTMFEDMTPDLASWSETRPTGLASYCAFEFVGNDVDDPEQGYQALFAAIDAHPNMELSSVAVDCRGEVLLGDGINSAAVSEALAQGFLASIEAVSDAEIGSTAGNRHFPRVAILDSVTNVAMPTPVNEHGWQMADIVGRVACPGDDVDCLDEIVHYVAMPRDEFEAADYSDGGQFGTMGDLAAAVVAAVGHWRQDRLTDSKAPRNLVINMSLGWIPDDPTFTTTDPDRGPTRALEAALYYAACNGAIVFAAAGNTSEPACPNNAQEQGPLAPATYGDRIAPDATTCEALGFADVWGNYPDFGERSLVFPVAGLDGFGDPIANHRALAMAPLAAHAANVTVERPNGSYSETLTGTSNAAAVASGAAALMLAYNPSLSPAELFDALHDSGVDTGMDSDFGTYDGNSVPVNRISVCGALESACVGVPLGHCPALSCAQAQPPADGYLANFQAAVAAELANPGNPIKRYDLSTQVPVAPICTPLTWTEQIRPQPEHPSCQHCVLDVPDDELEGNDTLDVQINQYAGQIDHMILKTRTAVGYSELIINDGDIIASVNDPTMITEIDLEVPGATSAVLTFVLSVTGEQQDGPIPVIGG